MKIMTLCIIHQSPRVLFAMKKRGFGEGRLNFPGGKVQEGEDPLVASRREAEEELGIITKNEKKIGIIMFSFADESEPLEVHIFKTSEFEKEPQETEEMKPRWFEECEIPYDRMWTSDEKWLPLALSNTNFIGFFLYNNPEDQVILTHTVDKVKHFTKFHS